MGVADDGVGFNQGVVLLDGDDGAPIAAEAAAGPEGEKNAGEGEGDAGVGNGVGRWRQAPGEGAGAEKGLAGGAVIAGDPGVPRSWALERRRDGDLDRAVRATNAG